MSDSILVPLDANPTAEAALPYASLFARGLRRPLRLLTVVPDAGELRSLMGSDIPVETLAGDLHTVASEYLERTASNLGTGQVAVTTEIAVGSPAPTIIEAASSAGLIAMATHGRVGPQRWFMGSVADKVVRTSPCPVLLIRPADEERAAPTVEHVIVPLDGSPLAETALDEAVEIATAFNATIVVVRAIPNTLLTGVGFGGPTLMPSVIDTIERDVTGYLEATAERVRAQGVNVQTHCGRFVDAASEVIAVAEAHSGALVVMTSHGRSGVRRTVLGSVTDRVVRSSAAPVLVIPLAEVDA